jgi:hypothetical protein
MITRRQSSEGFISGRRTWRSLNWYANEGVSWESMVAKRHLRPSHLEGITHQPPTRPSRSAWILETLTPQIRKINMIFAMFRVFSIILIFYFYFPKTWKNEKILVGRRGQEGDLGGWWVIPSKNPPILLDPEPLTSHVWISTRLQSFTSCSVIEVVKHGLIVGLNR